MKKKISEKQLSRTWVEIDYAAIQKNTETLKALLAENVSLIGVVESNAYNHGLVESARAILRGGATWLAVSELNEALTLRSRGIKAPIIVLGYTFPELYKLAADKNVSLTISSLESLRTLAGMRLKKKLRIHLKFDTGLHRQGILETHVQQVVRTLSAPRFPAILEGAYTHFAVMEDPMRQEYSRAQARTFKSIMARLAQRGFAPMTHISATSGILFSRDFNFDAARGGIGLYGLWPSPEIRKWADGTELVPALAWKTIITEVKLVNRGVRVGYDLTHETSRASRLAIIPVGYWHGLPRSLSNAGQVLVSGKRADIVGRVSMDMTIIDVTDIPSVAAGDEVVIIGRQGKECISVEEFAEKAGTINYEAVTRINPLIPRVSAAK